MGSRRTRCHARGSAAVEGLLSATFLGFFAIAMTDFAGGMRSMQQTPRAARHVAWAAERADYGEWPEQSAGTGDMRRLHFAGKGASPTTTSGPDTIGATALYELSQKLDFITERAREFKVEFAHGILPFALGEIHGTSGSAAQTYGGFRLLPNGGSSPSSHFVSIRSFLARDPEDPEDPDGWWAPIESLKRKFMIP